MLFSIPPLPTEDSSPNSVSIYKYLMVIFRESYDPVHSMDPKLYIYFHIFEFRDAGIMSLVT